MILEKFREKDLLENCPRIVDEFSEYIFSFFPYNKQFINRIALVPRHEILMQVSI